MRRLVAAPDKFRGTATALEVAAAIADGARSAGFDVVELPLSDGGEGFLDCVGGTVRTETVSGPLGAPTTARWSFHDDRTAFIESAQAVGRSLLSNPRDDDPMVASTAGVGELVAAAIIAGATTVVVGCGGTSSTDGGRGCVDALEARGLLGALADVALVAAVDVDICFAEAPSLFGPQKGASPEQVRLLEARLDALATEYLTRFGVDVASVAGAGAGGGLAGGLVALGAAVVGGAAFVASRVGLADALAGAEVVVTGEGRLDTATLRGKVVREVLAVAEGVDALVVVGQFDEQAAASLRAGRHGRVEVRTIGTRPQDRRGTPGGIRRAVVDYLTTKR